MGLEGQTTAEGPSASGRPRMRAAARASATDGGPPKARAMPNAEKLVGLIASARRCLVKFE